MTDPGSSTCGFRWSDALRTPGHAGHSCGLPFNHPAAHVCHVTVRDDRQGNPLPRPQPCGAVRKR